MNTKECYKCLQTLFSGYYFELSLKNSFYKKRVYEKFNDELFNFI